MSNSNDTTTADRIAADFGDDGQQFSRTRDGLSLVDVLESEPGVSTEVDIDRDATRYNFADGSAIIVTPAAWDLAIPGSDPACMCWAGADHGRHSDECEHQGSDDDDVTDITDEQIEALRQEAAESGDEPMVHCCFVAIGEREPGDGQHWPASVGAAREACAEAIEAAAQGGGQ